MNTTQIIKDCKIGNSTKVWNFVNLFGCTIGSECIVGSFVEIQRGVIVGNKVKIGSHSFLCTGVAVQDEAFIGHHVIFTNDKFPKSTNDDGTLQTSKDWKLIPTLVKNGASIGSGSTILCGVAIGAHALVGAGSVVTHDVPDYAIVVGNPAKVIGTVKKDRST